MIEGNILPMPPSDFCKRLHEFDHRLQLNWDRQHGAWGIWCKEDDGSISHVMSVVEPNGGFRPLDERVFKILRANRHFAQHPDELEKILIDRLLLDVERQERAVHDEMKYISCNKTFRKEFDKIIEDIKAIPEEDWEEKWKNDAIAIKRMPHPNFDNLMSSGEF